MDKSQCFVVVFGAPTPESGDPVESGIYTAGPGYPGFTAKPGDLLLLYCTEAYAEYSQKIAGLGIVQSLTEQDGFEAIRYRWLPFAQPIPRSSILQSFTPEDSLTMRHLGVKAHRVFAVSGKSFLNVSQGQSLAWEKIVSA